MGCLVDTFIITPKQEWRDAAAITNDIDIQKILPYIPQYYHRLLSALLQEFESLNIIMDNRDKEKTLEVLYRARDFETEGVWFSDRRRGKCLQQAIRKAFYDTILIIENDYNPYKYDQFIVVLSNEVVTESKWERDVKHTYISLAGRFQNSSNGKVLSFKARQT
jgi:hypothetical protein